VLVAQRSKLIGIAMVVCLTAMVTFLAGLASAAPNPPGNNGTVKIDDVAFDDHPNNEPHVGCVFQVDFYGYDEGDLDATVTFESHPPTGPLRVLLTDTVFIGEDDNSGGGSQDGLDASVTYTLDFSGIEPHPNQGFHVKLTVNAEGSQGADVKHKVFWSTGCVPAPTTTTTAPTTTTSSTTTTTGATSTSGATSSSGATTTSEATSTSLETSTTSAVGGSSSSTPGGPTGDELPFTGSASMMPLLALGLALLGLGGASLLGKSRRGRT
jgi:LPXTG-motif cell wall-anchored protein